jgi:hypothetical protein
MSQIPGYTSYVRAKPVSIALQTGIKKRPPNGAINNLTHNILKVKKKLSAVLL